MSKGNSEMTKYPETIHETHDSWGDKNYYYNEKRFDEEISILQELGDDWADIGNVDCNTYSFQKEVNGKAIYRQNGIRRDWYVIFKRAIGNNSEGMFIFVEDSFHSIEDAEEYIAG
jgi:hypothetical protein